MDVLQEKLRRLQELTGQEYYFETDGDTRTLYRVGMDVGVPVNQCQVFEGQEEGIVDALIDSASLSLSRDLEADQKRQYGDFLASLGLESLPEPTYGCKVNTPESVRLNLLLSQRNLHRVLTLTNQQEEKIVALEQSIEYAIYRYWQKYDTLGPYWNLFSLTNFVLEAMDESGNVLPWAKEDFGKRFVLAKHALTEYNHWQEDRQNSGSRPMFEDRLEMLGEAHRVTVRNRREASRRMWSSRGYSDIGPFYETAKAAVEKDEKRMSRG